MLLRNLPVLPYVPQKTPMSGSGSKGDSVLISDLFVHKETKCVCVCVGAYGIQVENLE